ncbi:hypothetical protein CDL12_24771 [Handroanthus impetiginosus]|uniref:BZIP domain-containing protein n=1 Tax=Handroanthus impetiginosus TaxID=429701 RepID=A0A2G9GBP7_9LAMI|nr:hypothetical protein CDL12_24771 [Handroanthus impetiginosus]
MANSKGPSNVRSMLYNGKNSLLPPKSPFPSISPSYAEYIPNPATGPKALPKPREGSSHHQRTSSESFLIEEQPSWLDELLDEPETPVRRGGHRRSSSDSFAYIDSVNVGNMSYVTQDDNRYNNMTPVSSWGSQDFDIYRDARQSPFFMDLNPPAKSKSRPWDAPIAPPRGLPSPRGNTLVQNAGSLSTSQNADKNPSLSTEKQDLVESGPQDPKGSTEKKDSSHAKSSDKDTKRAKQQFAQRSRVRKLQYIAELERNVQALQAEGSEVSAELEFLNQQNIILSMENKALKQRLESLAQEQLIKYLEHEVLEREVGRLRNLYKQQQQPPQQQHTSSSHRRANSRDLDQQFANLSLKPKEASTGAGRDSVSGQLHM